MPAETPLGLWSPVGHLVEVGDSIQTNPPPLNRVQLLFDKVFPEMHRLGCTGLQKHSLASPDQGGAASSNIYVDLSGVDVDLHAKFQP